MRAFLTATLILVPGSALAQVPDAIQVPEIAQVSEIAQVPETIQVPETGFLNRQITVDGTDYDYQVYIPQDYQPTEEWPVILFLHGTDEVGDAGLRQTQAGLGSAIRNNPERWPTIAIFPQLPVEADLIWRDVTGQMAMDALDATMEEFNVDDSRVYLTGISLGGEGTWYLGHKHPERFAALVPIAGYVEAMDGFDSFIPASSPNIYEDVAEQVQTLPVWIFHGDKDKVVRVEESRLMYDALSSVNADVHYSELIGVEHNSWDMAYADEELPKWLLAQDRDQTAKASPRGPMMIRNSSFDPSPPLLRALSLFWNRMASILQ